MTSTGTTAHRLGGQNVVSGTPQNDKLNQALAANLSPTRAGTQQPQGTGNYAMRSRQVLLQNFTQIDVAGEPVPVVKPKKPATKQPLDAHMAAARLRLFVFDRTTGAPIHGAAVHVKTLSTVNEGGDRSVAKAFGNMAYSQPSGMCTLKLLAGYGYVITATCPGYHKFGELGEYLLVTPKESERVEKAMGMVPQRISIAVTLRELRPLGGPGMQMDPHGQVNPLYEVPHVDKMSVQPQKVAFMTPSGVKQHFLATTLMAHDVLCVSGDQPQPAATAYLDHKRSAEADAALDLAATAPATTITASSSGMRQSWAEPHAPGSVSRHAVPGATSMGATVVDEEGRTWVYSSDSEGHCYFYGPRIDAGKAVQVPSNKYMDAGPWQYAKKRHMETNIQSLPQPLFEMHPATRTDSPPSPHVAASLGHDPAVLLSGEYGPNNSGRSGSVPPGRPRPASAGRTGGSRGPPSDTSLFTLRPSAKRGWLGIHPEIEEMIMPPDMVNMRSRSVSPGSSPRSPGRGRTQSPRSPGGYTSHSARASLSQQGTPPETAIGNGSRHLSSAEQLLQSSLGVWDEKLALKQATLACMGIMPMDPEGVHNYLLPGSYNLRMTDANRSLIFYTYNSDIERSQITQAQNELISLNMPNIDDSYLLPQVEGSPQKRTTFPVQLYCRARPWFQIVVYDVDTAQEVGGQHFMHYTIKRLDYTRSMAYRVARMRALFSAVGTLDPSALPEGEVDTEALEYIAAQEAQGRLSGLWAKAEVQEMERDVLSTRSSTPVNTAAATHTHKSSSITGTSPPEEQEDMDNLFVTIAEGELSEDMSKVWVTPGETYQVTVHVVNPYVEILQRQTRVAGWELEPWVFYASHKVKLLVGCREVFSRDAIQGMRVKCEVHEFPKPPRPPIVRPEWCEKPETYARRLLDTLIDHVVQEKANDRFEEVVTELWSETDVDGIATFYVPPGARVTITCEVGDQFEDTACTVTRELTWEAEQFTGFALERIVFTHPNVVDCLTNAPLSRFTIKAYDVSHLVVNQPQPDTQSEHSKKSSRRRRQEEDEALAAEMGRTSVQGLEPFWTGMTDEDGSPLEPVKCRAGRTIKLIVVDAPEDYLLPEYFKPFSGSVLVQALNRHHVKFLAPPKPRIKVRANDGCTMEWVHGVRVLVMARRIEPAFIAEGEDKSPQERLEDIVRLSSEKMAEADRLAAEAAAAEAAKAHAHATATAADAAAQKAAAAAQVIADEASVAGAAGSQSQFPEDDEKHTTLGATMTNKTNVLWDGHDVPKKPGPAPPSGPQMSPLQLNLAVTQQVQDLTTTAMLASQTPVMQSGAPNGVATATPVTGPNGQPMSAWGNNTTQGSGGVQGGVQGGGGGVQGNDSGVQGMTQGRRESKGGGVQGGGPPQQHTGKFTYAPSEVSSHDMSDVLGTEDSIAQALREAQEEEEERVEEVNPLTQTPWGPIWYDTWTGHPDMEPDAKGLMVDAGMEVVVQIFPEWPFMGLSQSKHHKQLVWQDPPPIEFMMPRDDNAFRMWMERDRVLHTFYDESGQPRLPYHPLARLQPHCPTAQLLGSFHPGLKLLKPAACQPGGVLQPAGVAGGGHGSRPGGQLLSAGVADGGHGSRPGGQLLPLVGPGPLETVEEDNGGLPDCPSAVQFTAGSGEADEVRAAARAHMRLADSAFLPLERTRLLALIAKWGAFPHILGGTCRACQGLAPSHSCPFLMIDAHNQRPYDSDSNATVTLSSAAERELKTGYRSALLADGKLQLAAAWAIKPKGSTKATQLPPHLRHHQPDKFARTHTIIARSEAVYCESPFFTWRFPSGAVMHVGVHELLYCDLVTLIDRTAASLEFIHQHIIKVKAHNESRGKHGRFLVGHETADKCQGGLFVLDVSRAQPFGAVDFVLDQLGQLWDHWDTLSGETLPKTTKPDEDITHVTTSLSATATTTLPASPTATTNTLTGAGETASKAVSIVPTTAVPAPAANRLPVPLVGFLVVSGHRHVVMKPGMFRLDGTGNNGNMLREWWARTKAEGGLPLDALGFKMPEVLKASLSLAGGLVPTYLIAGGLISRVRGTPQKISRTLYDAQLEVLGGAQPFQPINTVELYPMPKLKSSKGKGLLGSSKAGSSSEDETDPATARGTRRSASANAGATSIAWPDEELGQELSLTSVACAADIFELLQAALASARVRLVDVFRELDREGSKSLTAKQLMRLVRRFVPDATASHMRYLQLLLDVNGDNKISYKELSTAFKAANKTNMALSLRDELEITMFLQRLGLMCVIQSCTAREVFDRYDTNADGYLDQVEQWRMLKDLFPSIQIHEQQELFAAVQDMDTDGDERISWEEFNKAFASGGVAQMPAWGEARDADEVKRMKAESGGGPDESTMLAIRAELESKVLRDVKKARFPLTRTLAQLSGVTRGKHRRLDMGRARACEEPIDIVPLERQRRALERSLAQLTDFESSYGVALGDIRAGRSTTRPMSPAPGGGGGALSLSMEPPPTSAVAMKAKVASLRRSASSREAAGATTTSGRGGPEEKEATGKLSGAALARARAEADLARTQAVYTAAPKKTKKKRPASAGPAGRPTGPTAAGPLPPAVAAASGIAAGRVVPVVDSKIVRGMIEDAAQRDAQRDSLLSAWRAGSGPRDAVRTAEGVGPWDDRDPVTAAGAAAAARAATASGGAATAPAGSTGTPGQAPGVVPARKDVTRQARPSSAPPARPSSAPPRQRPPSAGTGKPAAPAASTVRPRRGLALGTGRFGLMESTGSLLNSELSIASLRPEFASPVPGGPSNPPGEQLSSRRQGPAGFRASVAHTAWANGGLPDPERQGRREWH